MRKYFFIGCGGFAGAILRYFMEQIHLSGYHENIPLNTLFINISGAFLLAFFMTISFETLKVDKDIRLGITTGFFGAYTTFSTLCKETVHLLQSGEYFSAVSYITVSAILGLAAAYIGTVLAQKIDSRIAKNRKYSDAEFALIETEAPFESEDYIEDESEVI